MAGKVDIFALLGQLDRRNGKLDPEEDEAKARERASFLRYPALRWMSTGSDGHLQRANRINRWWWKRDPSPHITAALLASIGSGKPVRHVWVPPAGGASQGLLVDYLRRIFPLMDGTECHIYLLSMTPEDIQQLFASSGQLSDDELKKAKGAVKTWKTVNQ